MTMMMLIQLLLLMMMLMMTSMSPLSARTVTFIYEPCGKSEHHFLKT